MPDLVVSPVACSLTARAMTIYMLRIFHFTNQCRPFWLFGDYQSSIDNAGQTREISLSTGSVWSCTEVHAQHIHTGKRSGPLRSHIDTHYRIFFSWLVILWYLLSHEDLKKKIHFQVCCQGKAGQGHRIESIAWYVQTIVYYTIFPNKNKWKDYWKKTSIFVLSLSWSNSQASCFKRKKELTHFEGRITHTGNILRTQDTHI